MSRIQSLRGFNDVLPADAALFRRVFATAASVAAGYGYGEIRLPILESTALFKRGVGEVTDIVEKEMFSFEDRDGQQVSLRPEGTASCVRAGLEHGLLHNQRQRLWYAGPMFRHERPQAGRYRQFHQVGFEAYGMPGPDIDVEVIAAAWRFLTALGLGNLSLEINSLGGPTARAAHRAALIAFLEQRAEGLDEDSRRRLHSNPLRVLDSKVPATQALLVSAPQLADYLEPESQAHFAGFTAGLSALGIPWRINPRLVRGLDYYRLGVFEITTTQLGAQATVLAGGRYDGLVEQLGGTPTPGVGWACGVERLVLLMQQQAEPGMADTPQVYICAMGEAAEASALVLAERLRDAGLRTLLNTGGGKLKAQLGRADKSGAGFALVLGESEVANGTAQLKSLRDEAIPEQTLAVPELAGKLLSLCSV